VVPVGVSTCALETGRRGTTFAGKDSVASPLFIRVLSKDGICINQWASLCIPKAEVVALAVSLGRLN
jgi:hypothetical protein